jgi:DNA-3-methyladenine glycosylase I
MKKRCQWPGDDPLMLAYHDLEWGVPLHDDIRLFEYLVLDAFQAGLSWKTILHRREGFRIAFDSYDVVKIASYNQKKIDILLKDEKIIRNRLKIEATVNNAKAFLKVRQEFGSFDNYIWSFTAHKSITNQWKEMKDIPVSSQEAISMSKDMKSKGFRFCGPTICYAFMQAAGMVNDHSCDCFRHSEISRMAIRR